MANSFLQLPADSTGKKEQTDADTTLGHAKYVIYGEDENVLGAYTSATFSITMIASQANQNLASMSNAVGSSVVVSIDEINCYFARTSTTAYITPTIFKLWVPDTTLATAGTTLTKHQIDSTGEASSASVIVRGASSADATATAITKTAPTTNPLDASFTFQTMTGVRQNLMTTEPLGLLTGPALYLRAGEGILVAAANTQNTTSCFFAVEFIWREVTMP